MSDLGLSCGCFIKALHRDAVPGVIFCASCHRKVTWVLVPRSPAMNVRSRIIMATIERRAVEDEVVPGAE